MPKQYSTASAGSKVLPFTKIPNVSTLLDFFRFWFADAPPESYIHVRAYHQEDQNVVLYRDARRLNDPRLEEILMDGVSVAASRGGMFVPPICTFIGSYRARRKDLAWVPAIIADFDKAGADLAKAEELLGPASMVVASGGKLEDGRDKVHAYWRLSQPATTEEEISLLRAVRHALAKAVGSDTALANVAQPLRWPGSVHLKSTPRLAKILREDPKVSISLEEAAQVLDVRPREVRQGGGGEATIDELRAALDVIPNDVEWDDWSKMGMAIWASTGGSDEGLELFLEWSRKSDKFDEDKTLDKWEHIGNSPPDSIGPGYILSRARVGIEPGRRVMLHDGALPEEWPDALRGFDHRSLPSDDLSKITFKALEKAEEVWINTSRPWAVAKRVLAACRSTPVFLRGPEVEPKPIAEHKNPETLFEPIPRIVYTKKNKDGEIEHHLAPDLPKRLIRVQLSATRVVYALRAQPWHAYSPSTLRQMLAPLGSGRVPVFEIRIEGHEDIDSVRGVTFMPGAPPGAVFDPLLGRRALNEARPFAVRPSSKRPARWKMLLRFIRHLVPDPFERTWLIRTFLSLVGRPQDKLGFMLLLISTKQGVGKTTLFRLYQHVVGFDAVSYPSMKMVNADFQDYMRRKIAMVLSELKEYGRGQSLYDFLKSPIADETLDINPKGLPAYTVPNRIQVLGSTNHWNAINLEDEDSRILAVGCTNVPLPKEDYAELRKLWFDEGGAEYFLWLARRWAKMSPARRVISALQRAVPTPSHGRMKRATLWWWKRRILENFDTADKGKFVFGPDITADLRNALEAMGDEEGKAVERSMPPPSRVAEFLHAQGLVRILERGEIEYPKEGGSSNVDPKKDGTEIRRRGAIYAWEAREVDGTKILHAAFQFWSEEFRPATPPKPAPF